MASQHAIAVQHKQQELLHQLITHVLPVKRGEENYDTAMEFCAGNLNPKYHRYKDVNPKEVQELYSELSDRMEQHSQLSKASHLRQVCNRLTSLGLQGNNEDMDAALLLLLFGLANRPLQRGKILTPQPAVEPAHTAQERAAAVSTAAASSEAVSSSESASEEASSSWSSESDLSDWEDGEDEGKDRDTPALQGFTYAVDDTTQGMQSSGLLTATPLRMDAAGAAAKGHAKATPAKPSCAADLPPSPTKAHLRTQARTVSTRADIAPSAGAAGRLHMPAFPPMPDASDTTQGAAPPPQQQQLAVPSHTDLVPSIVLNPPITGPSLMKVLNLQLSNTLHWQQVLNLQLKTSHLLQVLNLLLNNTSTCFERCWPAPPSAHAQPPSSGHTPTPTPAPFYQPLQGLHVPYLSPGMLHSLLCEFAEAGSQVAWLQAVIASSTTAAAGQAIRVPGIADCLHATPCCQAMLQAAAAQLRTISRPLIELQQANQDKHTSSPSGMHGCPTLLQLRELCSVPMRRVATLHEAVHLALVAQAAAERTAKSGGGTTNGHASSSSTPSISPSTRLPTMRGAGDAGRMGFGGLGEDEVGGLRRSAAAAHASSVLLDALHLMLESNALMTGPVGQVLQQQLLHLFLCALTPLLDGLYTWLYDNWEDHFPEDFFVAPGQHLPETHHLFWSEAFHLLLRPHNTGGSTSYGQVLAECVDTKQIACPRFLQPVACEIFSAGKSLRLLKNSEQGGASASSLALPGLTPLAPLVPPLRAKGLHTGARHRAPLQQQFLDQLHAFLAGHELCPAAQSAEGQDYQGAAMGAALGACKGVQSGLGQQGAAVGGSAPGHAPSNGAGDFVAGAFHREEVQNARDGAVLHPVPLYPPTQPDHPASSASLLPTSPMIQPATQEGGEWGPDGVQGNGWVGSCTGAPLSFSGRMAAAGLNRSTLQAGWMGPSTIKAMQPPLCCSGDDSVAAASSSGLVGDASGRLRSGGRAGGLGMGAMGGRDQEKGRAAWGQQRGGSVLEAQCYSVAAAMSKDSPSLAWEAEDKHRQSSMSIRPDVAHKLRDALMPSSLGGPHAQWLRPKDQAHMQLGWLLEEPCLDLPPLELTLEHCLLGILRQRVEDIGQSLLSCLLSDWGLLAELSALKNLFLMASPAAQTWADRTLSGMLFNGRPLEEHHEYELEVALQEVIAEAGQDEDLPSVEAMSIMLDKERVVEMRSKAAAAKANDPGSGSSQTHLARSAHCALHSVLELEGLQFRYEPSWLMSMIGGSDSISSYNNALVFLMQIRAARMALEDARVRSWKSWKYQAISSSPYSRASTPRSEPAATQPGTAGPLGLAHLPSLQRSPLWAASIGRPSLGASSNGGVLAGAANLNAKEEDLIMQEMSHFVSNLDQFVVDRLLCGAWMQLEQELDQARTLDDVVQHHRTFLATLNRQAGRGTHGDTAGAWKHLVFGINKVLDQVLLFCSALRALSSYQTRAGGSNTQLEGGVAGVHDSLRIASSEFRRLHRYLLKFLGNKTHKIGGEPDLENLIMRINFNFYYDDSFM
ncbi:Spc98 family-domain-containing protein [Dunaliella salina]|uniref:Spc98 family-domain-containing protein n=1 Tax=Dunaliella salina TaxID=3046 RepID=A0ABQ7H5B8_DUNSA|nr:Spc98 family-domain-containing protein [Dunaliella salina]|eukprot:KAF5842046.1 Spc98 family-domain-containing protein [Dunaliella salina]